MGKAEIKMLTAGTALRVVDIDVIGFDPAYQRDVVRKHKTIVAEFNPNALGVPLVGQREDGTLWCVDGRQRITALKKLGRKSVRAEVFVSHGPEHEAEVFRLVNGGRTKLQTGELFRAKLTAGDEEAWAIKRAIEAAGCKLCLTTGRNGGGASDTAWLQVRGITAVERAYRAGGPKSDGGSRITRLLTVIKTAWPGDLQAMSADIIGGMGYFYAGRDDLIDDDRLIDRLKQTTPHKVMYSASLGIGHRISNVAETIARVYAKRKTRSAS